MSETNEQHIRDLLPAYALGILDEQEVSLIHSHLANCQQCRAELTDYQHVAELLPLASPQSDPDPELKELLMQRLAPKTAKKEQERTHTSELTVQPEAQLENPSLGTVIRSWLAGPIWRPAALILIVVLLAGNIFLLTNTGEEPTGPEERPSLPWRRPIIMSGTEVAPEAVGILYISLDGVNGTLVVDGLPVLETEQQYQLWLNKEDIRDSGAVFSVNEAGYRGIELKSPLPLEQYENFGITIEPEGGSQAPTGERVLFFAGEEESSGD